MVHPHAAPRRDRRSTGGDGERVLVGGVARAAVLGDLQGPVGGSLDGDPLELDHAVDRELQEVQRRDARVRLAGLGGQDAHETPFAHPVPEAHHLAAGRLRVVEEIEEHVEPIEDHALGAEPLGALADVGQEAEQVEVTRLEHGLRKASVHEADALVRVGVPLEVRGVDAELFGALFEGDEESGLVVLHGAAEEALEREDRLAGAARSSDERQTTDG